MPRDFPRSIQPLHVVAIKGSLMLLPEIVLVIAPVEHEQEHDYEHE
ncbi:MAG: hypothetical protein HY736_17125 [Verrucomicrobia bacterium]|nr:hypothetical protein [Verrucomicrobiota bacterium]